MLCSLLLLPSVALATDPASTRDAVSRTPAELGLVEIEVFGENFGGKRTAWVRVPSDPGPWPVIMAFHDGRNRSGLSLASHLQPLFELNVLVVFPNGSNPEPYHDAWVGPGFERWGLQADRDVLFTRALVHAISERWNVESDGIYATGMGNGGYMSQVLWCEASDLVRAAFVVGRPLGESVVQRCEPSQPRPIAFVLGSVDRSPSHDAPLSVEDTVDFAKSVLGCRGRGQRVVLYDTGDLTEVEHTAWTRCGGAPVEVFHISNGGHFWPGADEPHPQHSTDVNATRELLRFFSEQAGMSVRPSVARPESPTDE